MSQTTAGIKPCFSTLGFLRVGTCVSHSMRLTGHETADTAPRQCQGKARLPRNPGQADCTPLLARKRPQQPGLEASVFICFSALSPLEKMGWEALGQQLGEGSGCGDMAPPVWA